MRDISRIDRVTDKFNKLWHRHPDLRFWQVISLLSIPESKNNTDPFFWEEDVWESMIDEALKMPAPYAE